MDKGEEEGDRTERIKDRERVIVNKYANIANILQQKQVVIKREEHRQALTVWREETCRKLQRERGKGAKD